MKKIISLLLIFLCAFSILKAIPSVTITQGTITNTTVTMHFTPNAECASYRVYITTQEDLDMWAGFMGSVENTVASFGASLTGEQNFVWEDQIPATTYKVFALAFAADETQGELSETEITTLLGGGSEASVISIEVSNIKDTSAFVTCTPNATTALFYSGIITKQLLEEDGLQACCEILKDDYYNLHTETDAWLWQTLSPATTYVVIAWGKNGNEEWGDTATYEFTTLYGKAIIANINVSYITDTSAQISSIPNSQTVLYYRGFVTKNYFETNGLLASCSLIQEDANNMFSFIDTTNYENLTPGTTYVVIAWGRNGNETDVWGDTVTYEFSTTQSVLTRIQENQEINIFPMPNNGNFYINGENLENAVAEIYSIDGKLIKSIKLESNNNSVTTKLTNGNYILRIVDNNKKEKSNLLIINN